MKWLKSLFIMFLFILLCIPVQAHPGNEDEHGCHWCWTEECYGEYHCNSNNSAKDSSNSSSSDYQSNEGYKDPVKYYKTLYEKYYSMYSKSYLQENKTNSEAIKYKELYENQKTKNGSNLVLGCAAILFILLFKRKQIKSLKNENAELKKDMHKIAKNHIDDWFKERYKDRPNPYTGKPILSEEDFNKYLEEYKKRHNDKSK